MNVRTLIFFLKDLNPDARVVIPGYEGGLDDIDTPQSIGIELNVNKQHYYGPHEKGGDVAAVYLPPFKDWNKEG